MNDFHVGDLIYVPSDSLLYNESETYKLEKPTNLLVIGKKNTSYEVFFKGTSWYVDNTSVYKIRRENAKIS